MEITRRDDLGSDLGAPLEARGGSTSPGYALMSEVAEGDVVVHYNSITRSIDGVSRVAGPAYFERIWWVARGSYARAAGDKASWKPGIWIPLADYSSVRPHLSREVIEERRESILEVGDVLRSEVGDPLYFPFTKAYGISAYQSYLAKFPLRLLDVLPQLRPAVESLLRGPARNSEPNEIEEAESDFAIAAGASRRKVARQGRQVDPAVRSAIEAYAMNRALEHYEALGEVVDKSLTESYDYQVIIEGVEWHIEVKGTTTRGEAVLLTPNEVDHALSYPHVALFIVSDVVISDSDGTPSASGGRIAVHHPWVLETQRLSATGFTYAVANS